MLKLRDIFGGSAIFFGGWGPWIESKFGCSRQRYHSFFNGKVRGGLSSLKKLKNLLPQKQLDSVCRGLKESHLRYANVIWGSIPSSKIKILQNPQNRARTVIER